MVGFAFEVSNTNLDRRIHNGVFVALVRNRMAIALEEVLVDAMLALALRYLSPSYARAFQNQVRRCL